MGWILKKAATNGGFKFFYRKGLHKFVRKSVRPPCIYKKRITTFYTKGNVRGSNIFKIFDTAGN